MTKANRPFNLKDKGQVYHSGLLTLLIYSTTAKMDRCIFQSAWDGYCRIGTSANYLFGSAGAGTF
jgi:hypothetical protein